MPLTPADVHNVAFSKPPIGKRGYNEDEVDAFLDLVEGELARHIEENSELRAQVEQLENQLDAVQTGHDLVGERRLAAVPSPMAQEPAALALGGDHHVQAAKVLGLAQEMADRLTGEAKGEADGMLAEARTKSEQLVSEARTKADTMVNEARAKADAMLNDARTRSETLERKAREKAAALELDAQRKHTEATGTLKAELQSLQGKIEMLRTMEREYRTRLKGLLESQLAELTNASQNGQGTYTFGARAEAG